MDVMLAPRLSHLAIPRDILSAPPPLFHLHHLSDLLFTLSLVSTFMVGISPIAWLSSLRGLGLSELR